MSKIRIGTRGSPLALAQAHETRQRLMVANGLEQDDFEIVTFTTTGDKIGDRPLSEIGGKGLFTKELEEALFAGAIDLAVHSMKDMPAHLPKGLEIAALLPREDARDAFVSFAAPNLLALPHGAIWDHLQCAALHRLCACGLILNQFNFEVTCKRGYANFKMVLPPQHFWPVPV
jgi:hydroxymethylbilane synthase